MQHWQKAAGSILLLALLSACGGGVGNAPTEIAEPTQAPTVSQSEVELPTEPPPTEEPMATSEGDSQPSSEEDAELTIYSLVPDESSASFQLGEILAGRPNQVIGTTNSLEGEFGLDFFQPSAAQFGAMTIDANTLVTDDDRRNQAIRRFILQTGREGNETIVFQPNSASGLPETVEVGGSYQLELDGELTVHGVSNPATFTGEVAVPSADRIEGSFETTVMWSDYDLSIPQVPAVADVDEEVALRLEFVAVVQ